MKISVPKKNGRLYVSLCSLLRNDSASSSVIKAIVLMVMGSLIVHGGSIAKHFGKDKVKR